MTHKQYQKEKLIENISYWLNSYREQEKLEPFEPDELEELKDNVFDILDDVLKFLKDY